MKLSQFQFNLTKDMIASEPPRWRDECKLMILDRKTGEIRWVRRNDPAHLNRRGEYLQACLWYAFFFDKPTSEIKFVPEGITPEDAAFLRDVAQKALDARKAEK